MEGCPQTAGGVPPTGTDECAGDAAVGVAASVVFLFLPFLLYLLFSDTLREEMGCMTLK